MRLIILLSLVTYLPLRAQIVHLAQLQNEDSSLFKIADSIPSKLTYSALEYRLIKRPPTVLQLRRNITKMKILYPAAYGGILGSLSLAWYSNYDKSKLHSFNDFNEWQQVDKAGHLYGTYIFSKAAIELWRSTGIHQNKMLWYGGLSGMVFQSIVEVLDGYSAKWGFSWSDIAANTLGTALLISQEGIWKNQRLELKIGFMPQSYDVSIKDRVKNLYGTNPLEQFIKDYNKQTIWLSANIHDFFPKTKLPKWLSIAFGYGANGMLGADNNIWKDSYGNVVDRSDIKRVRQFYITPDIKLTKIKVRKQWQRAALTFLNAFKIPLPALEYNSGGQFVFHWLKL